MVIRLHAVRGLKAQSYGPTAQKDRMRSKDKEITDAEAKTKLRCLGRCKRMDPRPLLGKANEICTLYPELDAYASVVHALRAQGSFDQ